MIPRALAAALAALAAGCPSAAGTLQTADPVAPGEWQVAAGTAVPVSTRFVTELADLVGNANDQLTDGEPATAAEERDAIVSAAAILVLQPSPVTTMALRRGIADDIDAGVRFAGPALRLDGRWRFAHHEGISYAASAGFSHHSGIGSSVASSVFDLFDSVKLVDYGREDLDVNLLASTDPGDKLSYFGALRYMAAFTSLSTRLDDVSEESPVRDTSEVLHAAGASGGLRLGTRRFALALELTIMRAWFEPDVLGEPADLGGWIVEPGVGVEATF